MEPAIRELLQSADDASEVEFDPAIDPSELLRRVKCLVPELERIVGRKLQIDENVQDATHHQRWGSRHPHFKLDGRIRPPTWQFFTMRFSNFGCLFTSSERAPQLSVCRVLSLQS